MVAYCTWNWVFQFIKIAVLIHRGSAVFSRRYARHCRHDDGEGNKTPCPFRRNWTSSSRVVSSNSKSCLLLDGYILIFAFYSHIAVI